MEGDSDAVANVWGNPLDRGTPPCLQVAGPPPPSGGCRNAFWQHACLPRRTNSDFPSRRGGSAFRVPVMICSSLVWNQTQPQLTVHSSAHQLDENRRTSLSRFWLASEPALCMVFLIESWKPRIGNRESGRWRGTGAQNRELGKRNRFLLRLVSGARSWSGSGSRESALRHVRTRGGGLACCRRIRASAALALHWRRAEGLGECSPSTGWPVKIHAAYPS